MPLISYLLLRLNYIFLKYDIYVNKLLFTKYEQAEIEIVFSNDSIIPLPMSNVLIRQIDEMGKSVCERQYIFSIMPRRSFSFTNNIELRRRGLYEIGIKQIVMYDLLGLFSLKKDINCLKEIVVIPKCFTITEQVPQDAPNEDGLANRLIRMGEDRSTIAYVREYQSGDRYTSIHWNLSSKYDEFITKVHDSPYDNEVVIIADLHVERGETNDEEVWEDASDAVVDAALSLAMKCAYEGIFCTLFWYDARDGRIATHEIASLADYDHAFARLAVANYYFEPVSAETILQDSEMCDIENKLLFVVTQTLDTGTTRELCDLSALDTCRLNTLCFNLKRDVHMNVCSDELRTHGVTTVISDTAEAPPAVTALLG